MVKNFFNDTNASSDLCFAEVEKMLENTADKYGWSDEQYNSYLNSVFYMAYKDNPPAGVSFKKYSPEYSQKLTESYAEFMNDKRMSEEDRAEFVSLAERYSLAEKWIEQVSKVIEDSFAKSLDGSYEKGEILDSLSAMQYTGNSEDRKTLAIELKEASQKIHDLADVNDDPAKKQMQAEALRTQLKNIEERHENTYLNYGTAKSVALGKIRQLIVTEFKPLLESEAEKRGYIADKGEHMIARLHDDLTRLGDACKEEAHDHNQSLKRFQAQIDVTRDILNVVSEGDKPKAPKSSQAFK